MFTVIGERINMTRKGINKLVRDRDSAAIAAEAQKQADAGATHIDVNAGGDPEREAEDMAWLTEVVAQATDLPLCFDSATPDALKAGLSRCKRPGTLINSITGETERLDSVLPLVAEYETGVIALTMDDTGMPDDLEGRIKVTRDLAKVCQDQGIALDRVYFDHIVRPASTNPGQARFTLDAVAATMQEFPDAHCVMGLSNVSYGIPERNLLNRTFLAMLVAAGADGAIIDPCEPGMMATLLAARATLGLDEFCMEYITAYREGKLG